MWRRLVAWFVLVLVLASAAPPPAAAGTAAGRAEAAREAVLGWYRLVLELVRHTPTYSPPVAARAFGYLGVAAWEAAAGLDPALLSLAGQLNALTPPPAPPRPDLDPGLVLHGAFGKAVPALFGNTGPTGQRAMAAMAGRLGERLSAGVEPALAEASLAHGAAVAEHVLAWSEGDGGAVVENMGFPLSWTPGPGPGAWVPTSLIVQQQAPLLPRWGENRPLAMPDGGACPLPPPPAYSAEPGSAFRAEAEEVLAVSRALTPEQIEIARFWSDDPMLSPTPPGHWISILLQIAERDGIATPLLLEGLARLGIALGDSFIACWHEKYRYDLLRPVTYIRRHLDPEWEPLLVTPPFPEYPSGHSTQSAAAATVLTALFGEGFAFTDATHEADGMPPRAFASFWEAAEEAAMSRLYGGIHFRSGNEAGLAQGRCVGAHAAALRLRAPG